VKLVSGASGFAFALVLLMDKDKSDGAISGLNYRFLSLYLFIYLGVWLSLSICRKYAVANNMERRSKRINFLFFPLS